MFWNLATLPDLLLIYAKTDIVAVVACGSGLGRYSSGAPDLTPSQLGVCDVRLVIGLILYLCRT